MFFAEVRWSSQPRDRVAGQRPQLQPGSRAPSPVPTVPAPVGPEAEPCGAGGREGASITVIDSRNQEQRGKLTFPKPHSGEEGAGDPRLGPQLVFQRQDGDPLHRRREEALGAPHGWAAAPSPGPITPAPTPGAVRTAGPSQRTQGWATAGVEGEGLVGVLPIQGARKLGEEPGGGRGKGRPRTAPLMFASGPCRAHVLPTCSCPASLGSSRGLCLAPLGLALPPTELPTSPMSPTSPTSSPSAGLRVAEDNDLSVRPRPPLPPGAPSSLCG